jgi:hypothetical protein
MATGGKARTYNFGRQGIVQSATGPDWGFLYRASTVKDPEYNVGDRVQLPDGRVFYYAKSGGACYTGQGNKFYNAIPATGIDYSLLAAASAVRSMQVTMTNQGTVAQTKDGLRNGLIILKPASGSGNNELQMRGIVGNTAGGVSDEITIYLDAPLTEALTTASYAFCMPSPWSDVRYGSDINCSHCGISAVEVSDSDVYHWEQTWGLCWIAPQSECGTTDYGREVVFRHDGSIQLRDYSSALGGAYGQVAGFIVDNNAAANGSTLIMLQVMP